MTRHFATIWLVHVVAALASGTLFLLRGIAMWRGSTLGMAAPVRYASYAIDTVLLAAAVTLAGVLDLAPLVDPWLTTKLVLVVSYVVLGSLALKRAPTQSGRRISLVAALLVFAIVVVVARDHGAAHWDLAVAP